MHPSLQHSKFATGALQINVVLSSVDCSVLLFVVSASPRACSSKPGGFSETQRNLFSMSSCHSLPPFCHAVPQSLFRSPPNTLCPHSFFDSLPCCLTLSLFLLLLAFLPHICPFTSFSLYPPPPSHILHSPLPLSFPFLSLPQSSPCLTHTPSRPMCIWWGGGGRGSQVTF